MSTRRAVLKRLGVGALVTTGVAIAGVLARAGRRDR